MNTAITIQQLRELGLHGMADRYQTIVDTNFRMDDIDEYTLLSMLIESEVLRREHRKLELLIRNAKLKLQVLPVSVNCQAQNGLSKEKWLYLCECNFIKNKSNLIILGKTGVGKSYCAAALAYQACTKGYKTLFYNLNRLVEEIKSAKLQGTYLKLITQLTKAELLVIDDFGLKKMEENILVSLYEIMEERTGIASTIFTSQLPIKNWYDVFNQNNTLAEAFLDRVTGNAEKLEFTGESKRRKQPKK